MNLPDEKREALRAWFHRELGAERCNRHETNVRPACENWTDALAPLLAGWLAEARGQAVRSMAHLFRDMAQETLPRHEVIALLDLRAESYRADAAEREAR